MLPITLLLKQTSFVHLKNGIFYRSLGPPKTTPRSSFLASDLCRHSRMENYGQYKEDFNLPDEERQEERQDLKRQLKARHITMIRSVSTEDTDFCSLKPSPALVVRSGQVSSSELETHCKTEGLLGTPYGIS
jgi:hypothetical protein